jgi:GWxTD domain-containing protein
MDLPPLHSESIPSFTADVAISIDASGAPGLAVTLSLPYPELQWLRVPGGYSAGFEVTLAFDPDKPGPGTGDSWERKLFVTSFEQTTSFSTSVVERRTFHLTPGRYQLRVRVRDLDSGEQSTAHERLTVPDYSSVPVAIADLELGVADSSGGFRPRATRQFGLDSDRLAARLTILDRRSGAWPRAYDVLVRLLGENGDELLHDTRHVSLTRSGDPAIVRPDSVSLFVGNYSLEVELDADKSRWRLQRDFEVEESGPPRGREFRRMLEPLSYIATASEIDALNRVAEDEQAHAWDAFWKRRDPTPDTPRNEALIEFLRRVRYAEEHFQHYGPGWRSDMGRIYIKLGPPDQTETRPATGQTPQIEVWYYNHPFRQFVFADREGFGRYVLVNPSSE